MTNHITVGNDSISLVTSLGNIGPYFDSNSTFVNFWLLELKGWVQKGAKWRFVFVFYDVKCTCSLYEKLHIIVLNVYDTCNCYMLLLVMICFCKLLLLLLLALSLLLLMKTGPLGSQLANQNIECEQCMDCDLFLNLPKMLEHPDNAESV